MKPNSQEKPESVNGSRQAPLVVKVKGPRITRMRLFVVVAAFMVCMHYWPAAKTWADDGTLLGNPLAVITDAIMNAINTAWTWFLGIILGLVDKVLGLLVDNIPALAHGGGVNWSPIVNFLGLANAWFPFDDLFAAMGVYSVLSVLLVVYRVIKSFVPTVSG